MRLPLKSRFPTFIIVFTLLGIVAISWLGSYAAAPVSWSFLWPFSPLGMLFHFPWSAFEWSGGCALEGPASHSLDYFKIFALTCLLESPFYFGIFKRDLGLMTSVAVLIALNAATHPFVFFLFPCVTASYLSAVLIGEAYAPVIEILMAIAVAHVFRMPTPRWRIALTVLGANLFSWQIGIFFF